MNPLINDIAQQNLPLWSIHALAVPRPVLVKIGMAGVIALTFLESAYNPEQGFHAIEFWMLLFTAAATQDND
jgi:hypothetical protein